jgi:cation:H+ antiporter
MLSDFLFLVVGLAFLIGGAEALVQAAIYLANRLGVSSLVIGLTVVAFGTSAPELLVSLIAAFYGTPDVAVGNVIGSNNFNILVIIGLAAVIAPVGIAKPIVWREMPIMLLALALMFLLALDGLYSRGEGIFLFLMIISYVLLIYLLFRYSKKKVPLNFEPDLPVAGIGGQRDVFKNVGLLLLGMGALIFGADCTVDSAVAIAQYFNVPDFIIGISVIAVGTSLPEVATTCSAAIKREADLAVGNAVGSNIFNVFCVIGATAMVHPLEVTSMAVDFDLIFMFLISFALWVLMIFKRSFGRVEGSLMIAAYVGYLIWITAPI